MCSGPTFKTRLPDREHSPASFFDQEILPDRREDLVEFKTDADWHEAADHVKVAFPVTITDSAATYGNPYGWVATLDRKHHQF